MHFYENGAQAFVALGYVLELLRPNCLYSSFVRPAAMAFTGFFSMFGSSYSLEFGTIYYFFTSLSEFEQQYCAEVYRIVGLFFVYFWFVGVACFTQRRFEKKMMGKKFENQPLIEKDKEFFP